MLVKVVQFQKRAELFVQLLSHDIGKLWGIKIKVGDPLKTSSRGLMEYNGQNHIFTSNGGYCHEESHKHWSPATKLLSSVTAIFFVC